MPYRMHSEYLRKLYLGNELALGLYEVAGSPIHLETIRQPVFAVGTVLDHVAPWRSVFKLTHLLDTDVDFVLTSGGHNGGIVSEPGHKGHGFRHLTYRDDEPHPDPEAWFERSMERPGSWWPAWAEWLQRHSSQQRLPAKQAGKHTVVEPAPGRYVLET
jgi:polyhydroxyalkanoate synthase subunit PhaC